MTGSPVIVALDYADKDEALSFVSSVTPDLCRLKVGKEMFTHFGPEFVKHLCSLGFDVFLDMKFHDIPNTVARAVEAAASLGVWMVNVHASGGPKMMKAAAEALANFKGRRPLLTAVTVLTSMDAEQLAAIGITRPIEEQVTNLALLAKDCGLDGVVCSAREASMLRKIVGNDFALVTPGIRPAGSDVGDQVRIMTPSQAISAGSTYLVIGRPITKAADPQASLRSVIAEVSSVS